MENIIGKEIQIISHHAKPYLNGKMGRVERIDTDSGFGNLMFGTWGKEYINLENDNDKFIILS